MKYKQKALDHEQGKREVIIFVFGIFIGLAAGAFWSPYNREVTKTIETIVEVEKPMSEKYRTCARYAYEFQSPSFWTGELDEQISSKEVITLIDHCLTNQI